ncbi:hypothetical protein GWD52_13910 [Enterobacteriaceae bacterium 4M9]|nr:hypothetical protein [Enterobacteriaceae bacterium 4M9]
MQDYPLPWSFYPQLNEERLTILAKELLQVLDHTYEQLSTPLDNNYTRATCTFGRQWQRIIDMCKSGEFDWLKLTNPAMDITFEIEKIPVRFFTDDPENPKKNGFYRRNDVDQLFEPELKIPVLHRFVVEKPEFEGEGAKVHFIGINAMEETVSKWTYGEGRVTVLHSVDDTPPTPVEIELDPISASVPEKDKEQNSE